MDKNTFFFLLNGGLSVACVILFIVAIACAVNSCLNYEPTPAEKIRMMEPGEFATLQLNKYTPTHNTIVTIMTDYEAVGGPGTMSWSSTYHTYYFDVVLDSDKTVHKVKMVVMAYSGAHAGEKELKFLSYDGMVLVSS